eukprot:13653368-Alexandrium_andersonii.AAC.1
MHTHTHTQRHNVPVSLAAVFDEHGAISRAPSRTRGHTTSACVRTGETPSGALSLLGTPQDPP